MKHLIQKQSELKDLEQSFTDIREHGGIVAVDTEFLREKTYSAKLCLVQLGIGDHQYCIDVLAIEDLTSLVELLEDPNVLKLLHAARQDMEVIYQTFGVLPKPIFDTQLAAAFCGQDMQIGHTALVQERLGIELAKSQARTDWTRRPLSKVQIEYAADDVAHLEKLYGIVSQELDAAGKTAWYGQDLEDIYDIEKYLFDPNNAYQRLSGGSLNLEQQYTLQALAAWREQQAQKRDIPRTWVVRDDGLFDLAVKRPTNADEIQKLSIFGRKSASYLAPQAADVIANVTIGRDPLWRRVEPLDKQDKSICSAMMKQLTSYAKQHQIAQGLLATRRDIEALYRHRESNKLLTGWRRDIVGEPLLEFAQSATNNKG